MRVPGCRVLTILSLTAAAAAGDAAKDKTTWLRRHQYEEGAAVVVGGGQRQLLPTDFPQPSFRGYRIAFCLDTAKTGCGQEAADKFCQAQRPACAQALSFTTEVPLYQGPTFQQGDGRVQSPGTNEAFAKITCDCDTVKARFEAPKVNGLPLDYCYKSAGEDGGTECGDPAATAFCKQQGYARSITFKVDPDQGKTSPDVHTWFIGENKEHTAPGRASFQTIDCGND